MPNQQFAILDYHMGNIGSLKNAFNRIGVDVIVTLNIDEIKTASALILPGVGQFTEAIRNLRNSGLVDLLKDWVAAGKPVLGICLGMQLLMTSSEECDDYEGLNIVSGRARRFSQPVPGGVLYKIPQIGWNTILLPIGQPRSVVWKNTLLEGLDEGVQTYFLHSYVVEPDNPEHVISRTKYGNDSFCSILRDGMVWGCQFHPERSAEIGQVILKNFVSLVASQSYAS